MTDNHSDNQTPINSAKTPKAPRKPRAKKEPKTLMWCVSCQAERQIANCLPNKDLIPWRYTCRECGGDAINLYPKQIKGAKTTKRETPGKLDANPGSQQNTGDKRSESTPPAKATKPQPKTPNAPIAQSPLEATSHSGIGLHNGRFYSAPRNDDTTKRFSWELGQDVNGGISDSERSTTQADATTNAGNAGDSEAATPPATQNTSAKEMGDVSDPVVQSDSPDGGPVAHEESRAKASNRWVLEGRRWETDNFRRDVIRRCRAEGMTKEAAGNQAWKECLAKFPPAGTSTFVDKPEPSTNATKILDIEKKVPPPDTDEVVGLSDLPESWPQLPANAQLQVEISWVSANRLRVRSGTGVDLSRALSPAPSYSALSWLETSILFPSKFADISVKATANQDDEREGVRREKLAIEEIRSLLAEMLEG